MKYTLVLPDGALGQSKDFDEAPPAISPNKGRWLPDNPPAYNLGTQVLTRVTPVSANATEIPYSVDFKPLDVLRKMKANEIETTRDASRYANVTAHGRPWQSDPMSQNLIGQAITLGMAGVPLPPVWRDANNNDMGITSIADLLAIAGAMAQATQAAYTKSWLLKAQINAATTPAQVGAAQW